jgi:glutaredoxin
MQTIVGNNVRTVPQIILNDKHVGGYGELEQYLNK